MKLTTKIKNYFTKEKPWRYEKLEREIIGLKALIREQKQYVRECDQLKHDLHEKNIQLKCQFAENFRLAAELNRAEGRILQLEQNIRDLQRR